MELTANLPNKLSGVIMIALEDLRIVEKSKKYEVDMSEWHSMRPYNDPNNPICFVCFAGAIISQSPGVDIDRCVSPSSFKEPDNHKLRCLNYLRCYEFEATFDIFNYEELITPLQLNIVKKLDLYFRGCKIEYEEDPRAFKQNMETVAAFLQEEGL